MQRGFSLIEILLAASILSLITASGLVITFESYKSQILNLEVEAFIRILEETRNRALNNFKNTEQSILIDSEKYLSQSGSEIIDESVRNKAVTINNSDTISFLPSSGVVIMPQVYVFSYANKQKIITILNDGTINY